LDTTYDDVDERTMEECRNFLRSKGLRLASFLNSLPNTKSRILKDEVGAWSRSQAPESFLPLWSGYEDHAEDGVLRRVDKEVTRALNRKTFHLAKRDMTNAQITTLDLGELCQQVRTELPLTHSILRKMIGPDSIPKKTTKRTGTPSGTVAMAQIVEEGGGTSDEETEGDSDEEPTPTSDNAKVGTSGASGTVAKVSREGRRYRKKEYVRGETHYA
jgi:hypothetical protein